jgi:hypothetical protein
MVKQPTEQPSQQPSRTFTPDVVEQLQPELKQPKCLINLTLNLVRLFKIILSEYKSSKSDYLRYIRAIKSLK